MCFSYSASTDDKMTFEDRNIIPAVITEVVILTFIYTKIKLILVKNIPLVLLFISVWCCCCCYRFCCQSNILEGLCPLSFVLHLIAVAVVENVCKKHAEGNIMLH
jgi:hypothetical protein